MTWQRVSGQPDYEGWRIVSVVQDGDFKALVVVGHPAWKCYLLWLMFRVGWLRSSPTFGRILTFRIVPPWETPPEHAT